MFCAPAATRPSASSVSALKLPRMTTTNSGRLLAGGGSARRAPTATYSMPRTSKPTFCASLSIRAYSAGGITRGSTSLMMRRALT